MDLIPSNRNSSRAWACLRASLVCYPEARLVCGAWLSFGRGKRGRFHPQNFAKTCHFTRSDSSRFAFWLVEFTRFWRCDSSWTSLSSHTGLALTVHTSEPSRLNNTVFEALFCFTCITFIALGFRCYASPLMGRHIGVRSGMTVLLCYGIKR